MAGPVLIQATRPRTRIAAHAGVAASNAIEVDALCCGDARRRLTLGLHEEKQVTVKTPPLVAIGANPGAHEAGRCVVTGQVPRREGVPPCEALQALSQDLPVDARPSATMPRTAVPEEATYGTGVPLPSLQNALIEGTVPGLRKGRQLTARPRVTSGASIVQLLPECRGPAEQPGVTPGYVLVVFRMRKAARGVLEQSVATATTPLVASE